MAQCIFRKGRQYAYKVFRFLSIQLHLHLFIHNSSSIAKPSKSWRPDRKTRPKARSGFAVVGKTTKQIRSDYRSIGFVICGVGGSMVLHRLPALDR